MARLMPKITEAKRESRRQQILEAARACFARDGFHATTTADIVRESGVSQGTLYLYFETKDDIVVALADDRHQGEAFLNALAESEPDPVQGLMLMIELYGRTLGDPQRGDARRVGVQGWAEALRNERIRDSVTVGAARVRRAIVSLIVRGQGAGEVRADVDPEAAARIMIATFQGLILQAVWGESVDFAAVGRLMRRMIASAFLTEAGRAAAETSKPKE
jgi:AcrR family transcriptional regulator